MNGVEEKKKRGDGMFLFYDAAMSWEDSQAGDDDDDVLGER